MITGWAAYPIVFCNKSSNELPDETDSSFADSSIKSPNKRSGWTSYEILDLRVILCSEETVALRDLWLCDCTGVVAGAAERVLRPGMELLRARPNCSPLPMSALVS